MCATKKERKYMADGIVPYLSVLYVGCGGSSDETIDGPRK